MSTLKTHNLQSPDAGSVNIAMAPNAGMVVTGISTFIATVKIGSSVPDAESGSDDLIVGNTSGEHGITIFSGTTSAGTIFFGDGTGVNNRRGAIRYLQADDAFQFNTNGNSEKVRITSAGLVGIGEDNPQTVLHINDNVPTIRLTDANASGTPDCEIGGAGGNIDISADINSEKSDSVIRFNIDGNERLRITSSGHVGIGTDAPAGGSSLHIQGGGTSDKPHIRLTADRGLIARLGDTSGGAQAMFDLYDTDGSTQIVRFISGGGDNFINTGGNFGVGTNSPDQTVHIHKGSAGSIDSTATSVLTLENSTTAVLQFLTPNNVSAQLRFGDPQDNGAGFIDYSHTSNTMAFGANGPTRMQLDGNGHLGIDVASVTQLANSKQLTLRPSNDDGIRFVRPGDGNNNPNVHLDLTTTTSGSAYPSGEAYTVKYRTYNCDQIFETYEGGGTGGHITFKTAPQGGTPTERLTINEDGQVTKPNQIAFHVYDSISSNAFSTNVYADFNSIHFNRGNCYSTSNGRFTCTVAGTYGFWCNMLSNGSARLFHEVRKNGSRIEGTRTESGTAAGLYQTNTTQAIVDLAVGDWIAIHVGSGGAYGGAFSSFCGYLLG